MDIFLAVERAFHLVPQISIEVARDRLEQKKVSLVAGALGALITRPKPEDIQLVSFESRLEAFWLINVVVRTVYERGRTYTFPVGGAEVHHVTAFGQDLPVSVTSKGGAQVTLHGVEHCIEEHKHSFTFNEVGAKAVLSKYLSYAKSEITELDKFAPEGVLVVPPHAHASMVIRSVLAEVIKPVQAEVIHEEKVNVETLEVNFRPIYALEYEWASKGKRVVLEFDGLTGEVHTGGKKLGNQIKGVVTRDLIFDVTADAVGMIVPGGGIAVKLVKAVVDRGK